MRLSDLRTALAAEHHGKPQVQVGLGRALDLVAEGLRDLAAAGHQFHLEPGPAYALPEWPRTVFHAKLGANGRVVRDAGELRELGPGWWPTLEAAQHADGVDTQFAGRGGVQRRGALVTVTQPEAPADARAAARRALDQMVAKWKAEHSTASVKDPDHGTQ